MSFSLLRSDTCPTCDALIVLGRAELKHRVAACTSCGSRLHLDVQATGETPLRAMETLTLRAIRPGPPTGRIEETLTPAPALVIRRERRRLRHRQATRPENLLLYFDAVSLVTLFLVFALAPILLLRRVFAQERLCIVDGVLEHRRVPGLPQRVRLEDVREVDPHPSGGLWIRTVRGRSLRVLDPILGHPPEVSDWVRAWILEQRR